MLGHDYVRRYINLDYAVVVNIHAVEIPFDINARLAADHEHAACGIENRAGMTCLTWH